MTLKPPYQHFPIEISEYNYVEQHKDYGMIQKYNIMIYPFEGKLKQNIQVYLLYHSEMKHIDDLELKEKNCHKILFHKDVRLENEYDINEIEKILNMMNIKSFTIHDLYLNKTVETIYSDVNGYVSIVDVEYEPDNIRRSVVFNGQHDEEQTIIWLENEKVNIDQSIKECEYHEAIVNYLKESQHQGKVVLLGGGSGILGMGIGKLSSSERKFSICSVDIDKVMKDIAMKCQYKDEYIVDDAIHYLNTLSQSNQLVDVIIVDINNDTTKDLFAPPDIFYQDETVQLMKKCLNPNGCLIINVVCVNEDFKNDILTKISRNFIHSKIIDFEYIYNEIIICYDN